MSPGTFTVLPLDRFIELELERRIVTTNSYPKGAAAVLEVLRGRLAEWIPLYEIQARTGQAAIAQRVSELRKAGWVIDCNRRAGAKTAYMLVKP